MTVNFVVLQPLIALIAGILILHRAAAAELHRRDLLVLIGHRRPFAAHTALLKLPLLRQQALVAADAHIVLPQFRDVAVAVEIAEEIRDLALIERHHAARALAARYIASAFSTKWTQSMSSARTLSATTAWPCARISIAVARSPSVSATARPSAGLDTWLGSEWTGMPPAQRTA